MNGQDGLAETTSDSRPTSGHGVRGWLGYPRGAWLVIGVEFWERFSFYGMLAILALFLTASPASGGFGWTSGTALALVGTYSGAMYALPALGGYLADRVIGRRRAVALGASCMLIGQSLTASPTYLPYLLGLWHGAPVLATLRSLGAPLGSFAPGAALDAAIAAHGVSLDPSYGAAWLHQAYSLTTLGFYGALLFLVVGNALMKSTLVVLCGETFSRRDPRREGAFAYYYLGISVGAMLSGIVVGLVAERVGWAAGFAIAAVGMAISLTLYLWLSPRWLAGLGERGALPEEQVTPAPAASPSGETRAQRVLETRRRIGLVLTLAALMCTFSIGWFQMFGSWSLFIERSVDRSMGRFVIPVAWFSSINAVVVIAIAPLVAALWVKLAARSRPVDIVQKYGFAIVMAAVANGLMYAATHWSRQDAHAPVLIPLAAVALLGIGEIVAWTATYGFVSRAAPEGYASVTMGAWYLLTLGLGGYLSGVTGAWVDVVGFEATFAGMAAAMAFGAVAAWVLRPYLTRLAARAGVGL